MSDKALMPKPHVLVDGPNGFARYRPALTSIRVDPIRDGGRRLEVDRDGDRIIFDFSAEQALHLAVLLGAPGGES